MLTTEVDNFPGFPEGIQGPDLMLNMRRQAERFGANFVEKNVESVDFNSSPKKIIADGQTYQAKSIIVATGADTLWLNVPGEAELIGRGVSSCAPCDAPFFKEKIVAIVGGGDSAMEEALVLTKYAKEVHIIHRRDQFKASKAMQEKVFANPKIKVIWNTVVTEVVGTQKVERIKIKDNAGKESEMNVDGIFVAIGHSPSTGIFAGQIDLDEKGYVKKGENMTTSAPGVYVAGDVHDHHYKQAVTAAGLGCMAAMEVLNYLVDIKKD